MRVIDELDIFRAAKVIIAHHGERAKEEALERMNKFREMKNEQAAAVWFRIAQAVEAIQLDSVPEGRAKN